MNFSFTRNNLVMAGVIIITLGFIIAGVFDVLDYLIVKFLLFSGFAVLFVVAVLVIIDEKKRKNRLGENSQADLD
ncbi:MAG: hypothetical protein HKN99_01890 [Winogradskyella sp.]|nr:hypothetical protein [Winogradskyella sp.]